MSIRSYIDFLFEACNETCWDFNYDDLLDRQYYMLDYIKFCSDNGYITVASLIQDHKVHYRITWKGLWRLHLHKKGYEKQLNGHYGR
jgi:hypothetical protein